VDFMSRIIGGLFPTRSEVSPSVTQPVEWNENWSVTEEVTAAVKKLSGSKKTPGPDGIPGTIIFKTAGLLMKSWTRVFTLCLRESVFPKDWKVAKLVLLYKKGKVEGEPSSYRPICLLSKTGKLFERVLAERLRIYLEETDGLSQEQYEFRKRSTVDAVLRLRDIVEEATEEGRMAMVVCLDIANAFNSLPWLVIREELAERGVSQYLCRVLHSYLDDRWLCYVGRRGRFVPRVLRVGCRRARFWVPFYGMSDTTGSCVLVSRRDVRLWVMLMIRPSWWWGIPFWKQSIEPIFVRRSWWGRLGTWVSGSPPSKLRLWFSVALLGCRRMECGWTGSWSRLARLSGIWA